MKNKPLIKKLIFILNAEKRYFYVAIAYGIAVSLLTLAIPISVQSLVNTITFGVMIQPLIVISVTLLVLLLLSGTFKGLQSFTLEMYQRHFYARVTTDITKNLLKADSNSINKKNGVELVNRYFDIMTIQKKVTLLITDFISIILQTLIGLFILALYHPYFLVFDLLLLGMLVFVWFFFGKKSIRASLEESKAKYKVANWLQEVARLQSSFQQEESLNFAVEKSDLRINNFLEKRDKHFRYLFTQIILLLLIYAVMSTFVLGLGGYLVIKGELSVGQLVAAELIVTVILSSVAKSGKYFESFYDLVAAIDKLHQLYELPEGFNNAIKLNKAFTSLTFKNVSHESTYSKVEMDFKLNKGEHYWIKATKNSSKAIFVNLLLKKNQDYDGEIFWGEDSIGSIPNINLQQSIYLLNDSSIFHGSIRENLIAVNSTLDLNQITKILEVVDLKGIVKKLDDGIDTELFPHGVPLWPSEIARFEVAKALASKSEVVIVDEYFKSIDDNRKIKILNELYKQNKTLIFLYEETLAFPLKKVEMIEGGQS